MPGRWERIASRPGRHLARQYFDVEQLNLQPRHLPWATRHRQRDPGRSSGPPLASRGSALRSRHRDGPLCGGAGRADRNPGEVEGVRDAKADEQHGIKNKIDPGQPLEKDIFELEAEEAKKVPSMPGSLEEALSNLESDHAYLLEGGVFTQDLINTWINYKRKNEADPVRMRPHPYEFHLYYDI